MSMIFYLESSIPTSSHVSSWTTNLMLSVTITIPINYITITIIIIVQGGCGSARGGVQSFSGGVLQGGR